MEGLSRLHSHVLMPHAAMHAQVGFKPSLQQLPALGKAKLNT